MVLCTLLVVDVLEKVNWKMYDLASFSWFYIAPGFCLLCCWLTSKEAVLMIIIIEVCN